MKVKSDGGSVSYPAINENAEKILKKRYFLKDANGECIEDVDGMFMRSASTAASAEAVFGKPELVESMKNVFFDMMRSLRFMPNTPTLINAGKPRGQLAACFVLPTEDSMEGIMDTLKAQALVQKSGGGTGFSFSCIRERGAHIMSTGMKAAGPIPVIKLMNYLMSQFIVQGGARNGANMGVLPVDHNDIVEFITFKDKDKSCESFNVSVAATDAFMQAVLDDGTFETKSRVDGKTLRVIRAREIFDLIVKQAWRSGDPGLLFIDTANRANPTPHIGEFAATNPCGEQFLLPNEACTLGHLNLSKYFIDRGQPTSWGFKFNWEQYGKDVMMAMRFLDNIVEVNAYELPAIEQMHKHTNRKVGLGVFGFADLLKLMSISYESPEALEIAEKIAAYHRMKADEASCDLGHERGSFGAFKGSALEAAGWSAMRNASRTTVAPTGSTAIIANSASTGIEPDYALLLDRNQAGMRMFESLPSFDRLLKSMSEDVAKQVKAYVEHHGTLRGCDLVSSHVADMFKTANEISYKAHILMQAAWQKSIDNAISKTINLPNSATESDIADAYMLAWKTGCKGITVYRDGCRSDQALTVHVVKDEPLQSALSDLCPECSSVMEISGGCETCKNCGYAVCKI